MTTWREFEEMAIEMGCWALFQVTLNKNLWYELTNKKYNLCIHPITMYFMLYRYMHKQGYKYKYGKGLVLDQ